MFDLVVVGGGIVGLASAFKAQEARPGVRVLVLEKEDRIAAHQTGRNSGVIHSGVYYAPGSLKAQLCLRGRALMEAFCTERAIPFERCGKVIVATEEGEVERLTALKARGDANGVRCNLVDGAQLKAIEPHAAGVAALHVPEAGIVDYGAVCAALKQAIEDRGGAVRLGARVTAIDCEQGGARITLGAEAVHARRVLTCGGLYADRLAGLTRGRIPPGGAGEQGGQEQGDAGGSGSERVQIVPFRGEYFALRPEARGLCRGLIYPVPDPRFPFLGVHLTKTIAGGVECGPNAVLALAREGYTWGDVNLGELWEILTYPGFLRLASRHMGMGAMEIWRSLYKGAFVASLQRLVPALTGEDLIPAPAGVRAQALRPDGSLVEDFRIEAHGPVVHVINAPSPAATASLAIAEAIVSAHLGG